jgi:secondary thiamine-phosphate synthase enzyme
MKIQTITLQSSAPTEVIAVTQEIAALCAHAQDGFALLYTPHTTAALVLCEDDAELREDIIKAAETMFAPLRPFKHIRNDNPNTEAHLFSAMAGTQVMVAIENGRLDLGTYQNILFIELDGPKKREIRCKLWETAPER